MTTKAYLLQLRTIDMEIAMCSSEAQSWRDLATKLHHEPSEIRVSTSPAPDRMENLVIKAADCEIKADRERDILIYLKETIEKQIKMVDDSFYRCILWGYYHDRKSFYTIGKQFNYSGKHMERMMNKAESSFERKFGKGYM